MKYFQNNRLERYGCVAKKIAIKVPRKSAKKYNLYEFRKSKEGIGFENS